METTTTIPETTPLTAFDKLLEAIENGGMDISKKLDVIMALADYIASK